MFLTLFLLISFSLSDANCLYELDSTTVLLNRDGEKVLHRVLRIKILNDVGRDRCGDIKVRYNRKTADFIVIKAYTLLENGRKVKVEKDAIMDVGAPETAMAPEYTNVQIKAVSFPALRRNATIVYEYEIKSKEGEKDSPIFGSIFFRMKEPIKKKVFILSIPRKERLNFAVYGDSVIEVKVDTTEKMVVYTFLAEDVNKIPEENFLPPLYKIAERVDYTSFENKEKMAGWIWSKFKDKLNSSSELVKETANSLKGSNDRETFYRVAEYVEENIRNVPLYLWDAGFVPHSSEWTLKHKYGDVRDKTVLAIALLNALGIKAEPVLVEGEGKEYRFAVGLSSVLSENGRGAVATPSLYKDMLLRAQINDSVYFAYLMERYSDIDVLSPRFQGKEGFVFTSGKARTIKIPEYPAEYNTYSSVIHGKLLHDGTFKGVLKIKGRGFYSATIRRMFRFKKQREVNIQLENLVKRLGSTAKVDSYKLFNIDNRWKNPYFEVYVTSNDFALGDKYSLEFTLPLPSAAPRYATDKERKMPLYVGAKRSIEDSVNIEFEYLYQYTIAPCDTSLSSPYNALIRTSSKDKKHLVFFSSYTIKNIEIPIYGYNEFRKVEGEYFDKNNRFFMLEPLSARSK